MRRVFGCLLVLMEAFATGAQAHDKALPLGDGKVSSQPQSGYIWTCMQQKGGGGAFRDGDWIQGNLWYPDRKIHVQGDVAWPNSKVTFSEENGLRVVRANDLPQHHTGVYPVQRDDPAYNYDRNPNSIREQQVLFSLPLDPQEAQWPSCVGGTIGFSLTGAWIFNGLDAEGRDAVAHEVQDKCNGHPEIQGQYHYHGYSPCMKDNAPWGQHSQLVAYAFDGFGIYGLRGEGGREVTNADLDACHGHKHEVLWNGKMQVIYHYHMTSEYPYTVGCFKGAGLRGASPARQTGEQQQQWNGGAQGYSQQQQQQRNPTAILQAAAQSLGVDAQTLRQAIGGPPPNFSQAARMLGIPEERIHQAFINAGAPN